MRAALLSLLLIGNVAGAQVTFPVTVHVTDQTGAFVPSAAVSACAATGKNPIAEKTDARGTAVLQLPAGACTVDARAPGFRVARQQIFISGPTTVSMVLYIAIYNGPVMVLPAENQIPTEPLPRDAVVPDLPLDHYRCMRARRALKGHGFSRAKNDGKMNPALAPEGWFCSPMHRTADPGVPIRTATDKDTTAILACLAAAFEPYRDAYTPGGFADTVLDAASLRRRMSTMTVLSAEDQGKIVGTIACAAHPPTGHLRGMAVLPGRQGTGVAAALLAAAEDHLRYAGCTRVTLDTTEPLQRAICFYTRHGYTPTGRVTDFFGMRLHEYAKAL